LLAAGVRGLIPIMKSLPIRLAVCLVLAMVLPLLITRAADFPVQKTVVYKRLKSRVDEIRLVDTHEHLPNEADYLKTPPDFLVNMLHYVEADLVSAGLPEAEAARRDGGLRDPAAPFAARWAAFERYWPEVRFTGYGRALERCVAELYGVRLNDLTPALGLDLNRRVAEMMKPGLYQKVLKKKAGIHLAIVDVDTTAVDREYFVPVIRFDPFISPKTSQRLDDLTAQTGVPIRSLADLIGALEIAFEKGLTGGMVGIKSALAYHRRIYYPLPVRAEAEAAFQKLRDGGSVSPEERLPLENFMMHEVCKLASRHKLPFQIHTGLQTGHGNFITNAKPTDLASLIMVFPDVKFVLFHGGYPYGPELSTMAKNFPNVYIDMCWLHIISPRVARAYLAEWIETVPANKIMAFGGDYKFVEGVCAHAAMARENVAAVLAEKVLIGYLTEPEAADLAVKFLRKNAIEIFRLPLK